MTGEIITTLLRSNDRLVEMLIELKADTSATFQNVELLNEIGKWIKNEPGRSGDSSLSVESEARSSEEAGKMYQTEEFLSPPMVPSAAEFDEVPSNLNLRPAEEMNEDDRQKEEFSPSSSESIDTSSEPPEVKKMDSAKTIQKEQKKAKAGESKEDEIIRVNLSKIDILNDYVGELIVLQSMIGQQAAQIGGNLQASIRSMVKISKDIQAISMSLRMLPVKPLIQKLQRVVRDTAQSLNKEVILSVEGDQLDIDKSVLDRLADPLIHMLRNAVDHGLETSDERISVGKTLKGHVKLTFLNEGNHLIVEVEDDGKGINGEDLRKKAVEKGIISENQVLTEKQLVHLIFHPGFSTKSNTSEISGRGVGMDVVKTNVEKSGG
ncbi:MAG: hypothetical protein KDD35_10675, partial [Bdellovibrionales bacterium]|nr:hypothetical protein [Bdellovibrionales bacterium]